MKLIQDAMLFVQVVQAGSLTKAAANLNCSKSQMSRKLSTLESRLNAQLIIRQQQGLVLTEAGKTFYNTCVKIHSEFLNAVDIIQLNSSEVVGTLRITAPLNLGELTLGALTNQFMQVYPKLHVELDLSDSYKKIVDESIDVAIRIGRNISEPGVVNNKIHSYKNIICASKGYIEKNGMPEQPCDLHQHKIISTLTGLMGEKPGHWVFMDGGEPANIPINPALKVSNHKVQKQMAIEGRGIIRIPEYSIDQEIEQGLLVPLLEMYNVAEFHIFSAYKKLAPIPTKINLFLEFLQMHGVGLPVD
ncbi:MAG: LysR family transcriptional regulator [Coxiellaceae bacterium]|nr:LysR family transcriptional regulator [Coxiellaceae bacterium]